MAPSSDRNLNFTNTYILRANFARFNAHQTLTAIYIGYSYYKKFKICPTVTSTALTVVQAMIKNKKNV